ncbi:hypothetical protein [Ruminococcus sp. Marseille-P6503]|uniref:hypothetical protein n=1 Tax=Ruminococcus sp. Marseille-P6503 TaxID=2364796 RepID=UPI000F52589D|nr:hypothetical protein [Ruminococcus sp. Marseille-P6503]
MLTVICFTTVCMLIASLALSLANYSAKVSNNNIRSTQAEITAQNYLQEYINSFSGKYDDLASLAGTSESSPNIVNVSMRDSAGNTVSDAGTCQIKIYKSGSGVVVKSEATYAGETEVASAYFDGTASNPYESVAAIEINDAYNINDIAAPVSGDITIENSDITKITTFKNNNGSYKSNVYSNGNIKLGDGTTTQTFEDTLTGNAPTITALGNIYINKLEMTTNVGKTDKNGKTSLDATYDKSALLNKNGYINTDSKIIITNGNPTIGDSENDIDIYCRGAFIGKVPEYYGNKDNSALYSTIENDYGGSNTNDVGQIINGNFYCIKGSSSAQDGDFVVYANNTVTINGDLIVDGGDIYIFNQNGTRLNVTGKIYYTGSIYDQNLNKYGDANFDMSRLNNMDTNKIINSMPTDADELVRAVKPAMDYAPGLYEYGVKDNPTLSLPSSCITASPNAMYAAGTYTNSDTEKAKAAKYIQDKYNDALMHNLYSSYPTGEKVSDNYIDNDSLKNGITVKKSCYLTTDQAEMEGGKITIKLTNEDIVVLLPLTNMEGNLNTQFRIDNDDKTGDYFCYFMFYDPNDTLNNYYTKNNENPDGTTPIYNLNGRNVQSPLICDKEFAEFNKSDLYTSSTTTNIFILLPDGITLKHGTAGMKQPLQAIIYGPNAYYELPNNAGSKVYGQVKTKSITVAANQNAAFIERVLPADNSILGFINSALPLSGVLKLEYFTKYKS